MHVIRIWRVLSVLCFVGASLCVNKLEYGENYADNYDNELSQDQQEEETPPTSWQAADPSRWDKLFITLEDSHMRQNMLLESLEQCGGGMVSLKTQFDELAKMPCRPCPPSLESACRARVEHVNVRLQQGLLELRGEEAERERRLNATLHQLLHSGHEMNSRLKRLEEKQRSHGAVPSGTAGGGMGNQPTRRPGGSFTSGLEEQEVTSQPDMASLEKAVVAMAKELEMVHLQLSRVMEQAGRTAVTHELPIGKK
ncbi:uncharacterized protein ACO6RY_06920 [Pungitius sinensis]